MAYETCRICGEGIITEADAFVYQHRPTEEYYAHVQCVIRGANKRVLTDAQCEEFRCMRGSFNDMVRGIFESGRMTGAQQSIDCILNMIEPCVEAMDVIEEYFDFSGRK